MTDQTKTSATKAESLEQQPQPATAQAAPQRTPEPHPVQLLQQALSVSPAALRLPDLLRLQRTVGNQVVQRLARGHVQRQAQPSAPENQTGLPDQLKAGVEALSGLALDDVKVHYNSSRPDTLGALAYTQGAEIHLGPGQEQHLPHEAWHVVQQKRGQVKQTRQAKGVAINDEQALEKEADVMGAKAWHTAFSLAAQPVADGPKNSGPKIVQRLIWYDHSVPEFQVDGKKPGFIGAVKALSVPGGKSRDHIVPYAAIENDLAVLLNNLLSGTILFTTIEDLTDALFPTKVANKSYQTMMAARNNLFNALTLGQAPYYQQYARALASSLNSSRENIRIGDAALNSSIGENLDADFLPGFYVLASSLSVLAASGPKTLFPSTYYLRLTPPSEAVIYEYQTHTTQDLSFVLNFATNTQVSSVDAPRSTHHTKPVAGLPVIVFDPLGLRLPFYYA